jgi:hypothetical protein
VRLGMYEYVIMGCHFFPLCDTMTWQPSELYFLIGRFC